MKLIWSRADTAELAAAMARHPAYIGQQQHEPELAPVIDLHTRERIT